MEGKEFLVTENEYKALRAAEDYKNSRVLFDIMMYNILVLKDIVDKEKAFDKIMDKFREVENIENQD